MHSEIPGQGIYKANNMFLYINIRKIEHLHLGRHFKEGMILFYDVILHIEVSGITLVGASGVLVACEIYKDK